jgi:hypothetical protein
MPNLIPDLLPWMRPAGRLIWACIALFGGLGLTVLFMKRPKPDRPATWAECISGAVWVFWLMTLAYAIIPHEVITFSDTYLQWDTTKFLFRSGQEIFFLPLEYPFNMDYQSLRDIIVVGIYGAMVGANLFFFSKWQARGEAKPEAAPAEAEAGRSWFGRPLRRKARVTS